MLPTPQKPKRTKLVITIATIIMIATLAAGVSGYELGHPAAAVTAQTQSNQS